MSVTVVDAEGVRWELSETITTVTPVANAADDWRSVLVFSLFGSVRGHRVRLAEARVAVKHFGCEPSTEVRLLRCEDVFRGRDAVAHGERSPGVDVRAGVMREPERGAVLLDASRPMRAKIRAAVVDRLGYAVRALGSWPNETEVEVSAA